LTLNPEVLANLIIPGNWSGTLNMA
jgi:hypothetical protein